MRLLCLLWIGVSASAASVYVTQPDDPQAVVVSGRDGGAVQAAIDKAAHCPRPSNGVSMWFDRARRPASDAASGFAPHLRY